MRRRAMIRILLAAPLVPAVLAGHSRGDVADGAPVPSLEALLERVRQVYAGAKTYRDTGVVTTTYFKPDGTVMMESKKPFSTAFVRPDRFRFEYHETRDGDRPSRYLIARDATGKVRRWWDVRPGVEEGGRLYMALAGATGVSDGSANTVPSLLLSDARHGRNWTQLKGLELLDDAETAGRRCHLVKHTIPAIPNTPAKGSVFTYWLDAETLLLRRIESSTTFPEFYTKAITTYEPVLNGDVPDSALAFDPPAQKAN
jgi:outer membrane lipoprotein-sorting protein